MIEFRAVSKRYADGTVAVEDFSAVVPERSTTVLVGSSGCGKTTLLRMVNRMVDPTAGEVWVQDRNVAHEDPVKLRRSIGYVLQNAGLLPHRRIIDNIAMVPTLQGERRAAAHARAYELMELVGLDPASARRYPHQLSGGQQQRVGVARALAADPEILLMDEPFGAVDPLVRRDLQDELIRLQDELGKTILFITHDIEEALLLGNQIMILNTRAEVEQSGTGEDLLAEPANDFVKDFIGLNKGFRNLHIEDRNGTSVLLDQRRRPVGILGNDNRP